MITSVGCCDSGLGGMLVAQALQKAYPELNIVFIADQKNVPYGEKSIEELNQYAHAFLNKFREMKIKEVVIACNTLCANVIHDIEDEYQDLHIHTIIEPTCNQLKGKDYKKICVLATNKTIDTHAYLHALQKVSPESTIKEIKAPKLVNIIENGCDMELLKEASDQYCHENADAWVLGCTHYPLIRPFLEGKGDIYDSNQAIVDLFKDEQIGGEGKFDIYTTKDPEEMKKSIKMILNSDVNVQYINLKQSK